MCSKALVDSHRWVYAVGVRVIDRCWGGAVIHIGWIPACWVWIGCSKPVQHTRTRTHTHTHTHTHTRTHKPKTKADESAFSSCLSNYPQRVFQASLHDYGRLQ